MILPKISLVTPTFNSGKFLEETIKSVISQNYPDLEYIIIDGGSTDNTIDIINKYSDYLAYWISEPDAGMYDAINKGFQKSSGDIMAWLNSDDLYYNGALSCVGEIFNDLPEVEWIIGKSSLLNVLGQCVKMNDTQNWTQTRLLTGDFRWIQQENVFWRRSLWNRAGALMNSSYKLAADFELWNRFFCYSDLHSVQTSFGGFRLHGEQLSIMQSTQYEDEVKRILEGNTKQSLRVFIGKQFFSINKKIGERKNIFLLFAKVVIEIFLKKINRYSSGIYYDFNNRSWRT